MTQRESLRECRVKELAEMARQRGVRGWHSMRKEQLVHALLVAAKKSGSSGKGGAINGARDVRCKDSRPSPAVTPVSQVSERRRREVARHLARVRQQQQLWKDLSLKSRGEGRSPDRDRLVVMVRDPFWLHAYWEVSSGSVARAQAALGHFWHLARPVLRVYHVEKRSVAVDSDRWLRDVDIHGGVSNWYVDVLDPPRCFRLDIGYLAEEKYYSLARSNVVTTPSTGISDELDGNWTAVAEDSQRIFARSSNDGAEEATHELRDILEERLRRPMGSPSFARFGAGAELLVHRQGDFKFHVDAEMIVFGATQPDAYVTMQGEPLRIRSDGTFTLRMSLPDRRQVIPIVASSPDGIEQRTVVLAVERNTKVMEPVFKDPDD